MGREETTLRHHDFMGKGGLQEGHEGCCCVRRISNRHQRAAAQNRVTQIFTREGGEVEVIGILTHNRAFGEEGGDEAGLTVHVAARRGCKKTRGAVTEIGRGHRACAARDIGVIACEGTKDLDRVHDAGVVEGHLVGRPSVIDIGALRAQHDVLDPVCGGPACGRTRTQTDTPRRAAISHDLVAERDQLFHPGRDLIARILEILRHEPNQRLEVHIEEKAVELILTGGIGIGAKIDPR